MAGLDTPDARSLLALGAAGERPVYRVLRLAGRAVTRVISVIALAVAWELFARSGAVTPFMLPALSAVIERIWNDLVAGDLLLNTGVTLYRALAGFLIGATAGIALGMAMSRNGVANWFFDPIISAGFPMPKIAFLPVDSRQGWSDTSFTSAQVKNLPPGPALVTVFTNGIPSASTYLVVTQRQR